MPFVIFQEGSFAVHIGDHFRSGDHLRSGIICGAVQHRDTPEQPSLVGGFFLISSSQNCQLFIATLLTKKEYIAFTVGETIDFQIQYFFLP